MKEDRQIEKLAAKAIRGNAKAYGQLIEYYKEYLYKTAWLSVKNEEQALDIVGDCILKGFRFIHTLKNPAWFKTWITRILINTTKDYYHKYPDTDNVEELQLPAPEAAISKAEKIDLYRAIDLLPERYRTIIILRYFDEMKISEIAYTLEIPEGSVKSCLSRAKEALKQLLEEDKLYENRISGHTSTRKAESGCGKEHELHLYRAEA